MYTYTINELINSEKLNEGDKTAQTEQQPYHSSPLNEESTALQYQSNLSDGFAIKYVMLFLKGLRNKVEAAVCLLSEIKKAAGADRNGVSSRFETETQEVIDALQAVIKDFRRHAHEKEGGDLILNEMISHLEQTLCLLIDFQITRRESSAVEMIKMVAILEKILNPDNYDGIAV